MEKDSLSSDFWKDQARAQGVMQRMKEAKSSLENFREIEKEYQDVRILSELAEEEGDESLIGEISSLLSSLKQRTENWILRCKLSDDHDKNTAQ